jgi:hypothetical protein
MKQLLFAFLLILPLSCSSAAFRVYPQKKGVDPTFKPYIKEYSHIINYKNNKNKKIYDQRISSLSINFNNLEYPVIGQCHWLVNGEFEIQVDERWWKYSSPVARQFLVYHELEHCIRFRMHTHTKEQLETLWDYVQYWGQLLGIVPDNEYFKDRCPNSIMNPSDVGDYCNYEHYYEYIQEMIDYKDPNL